MTLRWFFWKSVDLIEKKSLRYPYRRENILKNAQVRTLEG